MRREPRRSTCSTPSSTRGSASCGRWGEEDTMTTTLQRLATGARPSSRRRRPRDDFKPKRVPVGARSSAACWLVTGADLPAPTSPSACRSSATTTPRCQVNGRTTSYGLGPGWTAWWGIDKSSLRRVRQMHLRRRRHAHDRHRRDDHRPGDRRAARASRPATSAAGPTGSSRWSPTACWPCPRCCSRSCWSTASTT